MQSDWNMKAFCKGIGLKDKSVLEIGCGSGALGRYVLNNGARSVVGLEPMQEGSSEYRKPDETSFPIHPVTLMDFETTDTFDLIMLYDSLNHLDEKSCIHLRDYRLAGYWYREMLHKIYQLLNSGGKLVIADASRRNLYPDLGFSKNPLDRSIEWFKHQTPELWIEFLTYCGFVHPKVNWLTARQLRWVDWLVGNKLAAYFLVGHFRLIVEKPVKDV